MLKLFFRQKEIAEKNTIILGLLILVAFMLLEITTRAYNWYLHFAPIDIPTHFLIGLSGSILFIGLVKFKKRSLKATIFVFCTAILWEFIEMSEELVIYNPPHLQDFFFWDGFLDIIITTIGGISGVLLMRYLKKYYKSFKKLSC